MLVTLSLTTLTLLLATAIGAFGGLWLRRRFDAKSAARDDKHGTDRLTDAIAFVGGAFGILLGLLLVLAVEHFVNARQAGREEAVAVTALHSTLEPFPAEQREGVRRTLVCYVEAIVADDWRATSIGDLTGSENANAYQRQLQQQVSALPQETDAQANVAFFVQDNVQHLVSSREFRLLYARPEIPALIWVVIYASALVFAGLMSFHIGDRPRLLVIAVGSTTLVLVVMIGAMRVLDSPFSGPARIEPVSAQGTLRLLRDIDPRLPQASDCPRLAVDVDEVGG